MVYSMSLGQLNNAKSIANFAQRRYNKSKALGGNGDMGTSQALTTEQVELLILIECIEDFDKKNPGNVPPGGIKEILDTNSIMEPDDFDRIAKVLEYYGYLENGDELSIDGKQYINLFKEYLEEKSNEPMIVHNSYSLINIGNLEINLDACIAKVSYFENLSDIVNSIKKLLQRVKKCLPK